VASRTNRFQILVAAAALASHLPSTGHAEPATHAEGRTEYRAPRATVIPRVDGVADEAAWEAAPWRAIDQRWLGPEFDDGDFQGRFKVVWTPDKLWILVEIVDDVLYDRHRDPLVQYWDDDCLEIFIDEDFSGGDHQYNHNAFAYHMSLDNQAIDIGTDRAARSFTDHVESQWKQRGNIVVWELGIEVHPDSYRDDAPDSSPVLLTAGKVMGLMLAYCDNDGSELREIFIGSEPVHEGKKDRGWIDAGLFGKLVLDGAP
jgi:hypothetical protein